MIPFGMVYQRLIHLVRILTKLPHEALIGIHILSQLSQFVLLDLLHDSCPIQSPQVLVGRHIPTHLTLRTIIVGHETSRLIVSVAA